MLLEWWLAVQVINNNKHLSKLVPCVRQHLAAIAALVPKYFLLKLLPKQK